MKDNTPQNIVEFQPDALEIRNERLSPFIRFCVWLPFIIVLLAIIWGIIAKVDVVVQGGGKLVTNESTIVMKPLERSVIKKINVKIGDIVKKDQILITFDPTINKAEADNYNFGIVAGSGLNSIAAIREKGIDIHVKAIEKLIPFEKMNRL